jgi:hypothetical protein
VRVCVVHLVQNKGAGVSGSGVATMCSNGKTRWETACLQGLERPVVDVLSMMFVRFVYYYHHGTQVPPKAVHLPI